MNYQWTSPPPSMTVPAASYGPALPVQYHALPHQPHYGIVFLPVSSSMFGSQLTSSMISPEVRLLSTWAPPLQPNMYADSSHFTTPHHGLSITRNLSQPSQHHHRKPLRPTTHLQLPLHPHPHLLLRHLTPFRSLPLLPSLFHSS